MNARQRRKHFRNRPQTGETVRIHYFTQPFTGIVQAGIGNRFHARRVAYAVRPGVYMWNSFPLSRLERLK